ncbi:Flp1 family type IVb pilin [Acetitomaculum ruminis]|nr:Flp1 family type IVb pilin [Acetitomaculum ruminis]
MVMLIGLVVIFKNSLTKLMNSIFKTITTRAGKI